MPRPLKYRSFFVFSFLFLLFIACLLCESKGVYAHSPHDVIDVLEISPDYDHDKTVFIAIGSRLKKSRDGGHSWKTLFNGLDNKHPFTSIAISPSFKNDRTIFVSSKGDGIYRSKNGGISWVTVNNGLDDFRIEVLSISHDIEKCIVLAAGSNDGVFRSEDGGLSWNRVLTGKKITAMAFLPRPQKDYVVAGDSSGNLYSSTDGGRVWEKVYKFQDGGAISSIAGSSYISSGCTFFVGTEKSGLFKSLDHGATFVNSNKGMPDNANIRSIAVSPGYEIDASIFVSTWNEAVFRSRDGGDNWHKYSNGVYSDKQAETKAYWSPHYLDVKISNNFRNDRTVFLGGFGGLFKSTDGGVNWNEMETLPVHIIKGIAISRGDRNHSTIAITTYGGGAYTTDDQGATWKINNVGLGRTRLSDIAFSPNFNSDNTLFSASHGYLLKSIDRGNSWNKIYISRKTLKTRCLSVLDRLGIPTNYLRKRLLTAKFEKWGAFITEMTISPSFETDHTLFFGTRHHGVFKSTDSGLTTQSVWKANERVISSLVISPDFSNDRTLFAGISGSGVYRSNDEGKTWNPVNNGLTYLLDCKVAISPHYKSDKTLFVGSSEGLFKTTNNGENWVQLVISQGVHKREGYSVICMAISPNYRNDQTLIISVRSRGLYKSIDGGMSFSRIAPNLMSKNYQIELIKFSLSFGTDRTIYAATDMEFLMSSDEGETWQVLKRPVRYENHRDVIHYNGEWEVLKRDYFSGSTVNMSDVQGSKATFDFVGTSIKWIGMKSKDQGIADVYIDGKLMDSVDQFSNNRINSVDVFSIRNLPCNHHNITIEVTKNKNPKATGFRTVIDAFDIENRKN